MRRAESNTGITRHIGASAIKPNTAGCSRSGRRCLLSGNALRRISASQVCLRTNFSRHWKLLERTCMRIGNDEYVKQNESYGLTTLQDNHVKVEGSKMRFKFKGKSGQLQDIELEDPRLAKIVKKCRDIPGWELFQYLDESGENCDITSTDVNKYI